jgi:octaprenyl-diphosphate synthase
MNLKTRLDDVRAEYLRRLSPTDDTSLLAQLEQHITARMGKMLRPQLLLLAADTLGQADTPRTTLLAVAVEMLHNASLLHDDVIDHDDLRRGQPSANARFGNTAAVLAGDYLLAQVMTILHEVDDRDAALLVNRTVTTMVQAELLQLQTINSASLIPDSSTYLRIIDGKTASLFACACALGNPLYYDFGLHYGRLFQLRDDIADHEDNPFTSNLIEQETAALAAIKNHLPIHN